MNNQKNSIFLTFFTCTAFAPFTTQGMQLEKVIVNGDFRSTEWLLKANANPNIVFKDGDTPLQKAVACEHSSITRLLLDAKADPNCSNRNCESPLHVAVLHDRTSTIRLLLKAKADPNSTDHRRKTPLHVAALHACTPSIKLLLEAKANPNLSDHNGHIPLGYAFSRVYGDDIEDYLAYVDSNYCDAPAKRIEAGKLLCRWGAHASGFMQKFHSLLITKLIKELQDNPPKHIVERKQKILGPVSVCIPVAPVAEIVIDYAFSNNLELEIDYNMNRPALFSIDEEHKETS